MLRVRCVHHLPHRPYDATIAPLRPPIHSYVLKPSEQDPGCTMRLAELAKEAGLPDGVLNVIHGAHDAVNFVCDAPDIKAISFVGSNQAGEYIFKRGTETGKRVQANLGAKNHATILPDCDKEATLNALTGAAFGAAGQRCMALSVAVFVGETKEWIPEIVERATKLKVTLAWRVATAQALLSTRVLTALSIAARHR